MCAPFADVGLRPQVRERAKNSPFPHRGSRDHGIRLQLHPVREDASVDHAPGLDPHPPADPRRAEQGHSGIDDRVLPDGHFRLDVRPPWVHQGDAGRHQFVELPLLQDPRRLGQLPPGVDPPHFVRLRRRHRDHALPFGQRFEDEVRQVILPLGIQVGEAWQPPLEEDPVEGVRPRVHFPNLAERGVRVFLLHDSGDRSVIAANDPAVTGRVVENARQHRCRGPLPAAGRKEPADRRGPEERGVPAKHHDFLRPRGKFGQAAPGRVPRSELGLLDRHLPAERLHDREDLVPAVPEDEDHLADPRGARRLRDVPHHRFPEDEVGHFGEGGLHPPALPRGQDDRRNPFHERPLFSDATMKRENG